MRVALSCLALPCTPRHDTTQLPCHQYALGDSAGSYLDYAFGLLVLQLRLSKQQVKTPAKPSRRKYISLPISPRQIMKSAGKNT